MIYAAAGAGEEFCYYDRSDDYSSVAYWYQTLPTAPFPPFPSREERMKDIVPQERISLKKALAEASAFFCDVCPI